MAKNHKSSGFDTVGESAVENISSPFRWWVDADYDECHGTCTATVHYRASKRPKEKKSHSEGGESEFVFNELEVINTIPPELLWDKFGICRACGQAANLSVEIGRDLGSELKRISLKNSDMMSSDAETLAAFSLTNPNGTKKPYDDPFVVKLRMLALLKAVVVVTNSVKSFAEWIKKLEKLGLKNPCGLGEPQ